MKELVEIIRAHPRMRIEEIHKRCVLMGCTDERISEMVATLVDAELLKSGKVFDPWTTRAWVPDPKGRKTEYGANMGEYVDTRHEPDPNSMNGQMHYHVVYWCVTP